MIKFIDYLKPGEDYVKGEKMLKRGGEDMAGQEDLEYYKAHPEELEQYKDKYLIFGKALSTDDRRFVACLSWDGNRWILRWYWLGRDFRRGALLVRARKLDTVSLGASAGPSALGLLAEIKLIIEKLEKLI